MENKKYDRLTNVFDKPRKRYDISLKTSANSALSL